jgi:serine/threonine protein kinase
LLKADPVQCTRANAGQHGSTVEDALEDFHLAHDKNADPFVALKELERGSLSYDEFKVTADIEATNLEELRKIDDPHLIKAIAYITLGRKHFFMFPWATFGSLRDFCSEDPPSLDPLYLKWIFGQLSGLAGAIRKLHYSEKTMESWRHGDLKPDNILVFDNRYGAQNRGHGTCTLVITDVGLTKKHNSATEDRKDATRTHSGTFLYEPPEAELDKQDPEKGRSRRYDIWSIGCIYLEVIIWLIYGADELKRFRNEIDGNRRFYVLVQSKGSAHQGAELHNMVLKWIEWIRKDPRCYEGSAVRRLLDLIVNQLLTPENDLTRTLQREDSFLLDAQPSANSEEPPASPAIIRTATSYLDAVNNYRTNTRITANDMDVAMKSIVRDATANNSWLNFAAPSLKGPGQYANQLVPSDAHLAAATNVKQVRS